jgi:hypothetical protein
MMSNQSIYKLWAAYTLVKVLMKHVAKMHVWGHRILHASVQTRSIFANFFGILVHAVITLIFFYLYAIYNADYLAGQFLRPSLFFSACFHIQATIAKEFLPKLSENPPAIDEPIQRMVLLIAIVYHLSAHQFSDITIMIGFEYAATFIKFLFCALSEQGSKWYSSLRKGADLAVWQFQHHSGGFDKSLIVLVPTEVFAIGLFTLMIKGPIFNSGVIFGGVIALALLGPLVIKSIKVDPPEEQAPEPKKVKPE